MIRSLIVTDPNSLKYPLKLIPSVQYYHWGVVGTHSLVAQFGKIQDTTEPCAELWYGAHSSAPSSIEVESIEVGTETLPLTKLIQRYPEEILGKELIKNFGPNLPFLFKILSIAKPLSIQAHPDKKLSERFHLEDPEHYPDSNHKPEIGIAASDVWLLYGFRPWSELKNLLKEFPEIKTLLSEGLQEELLGDDLDRGCIVKLWRSLLKSEHGDLKRALSSLKTRLEKQRELNSRERYLLKFYDEFGAGDVGIVLSLLMQMVHLIPGQAIFIPPNIPHAYLSGELMECMANSDNVVRVGLTPKYRDSERLLQLLEQGVLSDDLEPKLLAFERDEATGNETIPLPVRDFSIQRFRGEFKVELPAPSTLQLMVCVKGRVDLIVSDAKYSLMQGEALIIPAAISKGEIVGADCELFIVSVP